MLFDPFCEEYGMDESEGDSGESLGQKDAEQSDFPGCTSLNDYHNSSDCIAPDNHNSLNHDISPEQDTPKIPHKSTDQINKEFIDLLLSQQVDPFAPWPTLLSQLSPFPAFHAVPSDKRRQQLLAQCCPQLVALKREHQQRLVAEAKEWFEGERAAMRAAGVQWIEAKRRLSRDRRFALLSLKECEQRYKHGPTKE